MQEGGSSKPPIPPPSPTKWVLVNCQENLTLKTAGGQDNPVKDYPTRRITACTLVSLVEINLVCMKKYGKCAVSCNMDIEYCVFLEPDMNRNICV